MSLPLNEVCPKYNFILIQGAIRLGVLNGMGVIGSLDLNVHTVLACVQLSSIATYVTGFRKISFHSLNNKAQFSH